MKRRGALLGGGLLLAAATAQAQTVERARRIGVMMDLAADDSNARRESARSSGSCSSWDGASAAICGSSIAGACPTPSASRPRRAS